LLSAAVLAGHAAPARSFSDCAGTGAQAIPFRGGRVRDHARTHSLLIGEPQVKTPSTVMQALKLGFARRVLAQASRRRNPTQAVLFDHLPQHIWQKRFYDFNVWTEHKRIEKLRYMHRNPVKRGLVAAPELWRWSSFRAYFLREAGPVRVNDWDVLRMKIRPPAA
jgi:REP element-mobilizing transposase RayT